MRKIASEIHIKTGVLRIQNVDKKRKRAIPDLSMAPGGYTTAALAINPGAHVAAFTLPVTVGGHEIILRKPHAST
jgi:hypothetical protein